MRDLRAALALAAALAAGCSAASEAPGPCPRNYGSPSSVPFDWDPSPGRRLECHYGPRAKTAETIGPDAPRPKGLEHVIVLMLENRSFDHYLSDLAAIGVTDADVAGSQANPDAKGGQVSRYHETEYCTGNNTTPAHEWSDAHLSLAGGRMDGFVGVSDCAAMGYYTHEDLPLYYELARQFAMSDRHFSPVLGPTWPNRLFFYAGTSCGYAEGSDTNALITAECGISTPSIFTALPDGAIEVYDEGGPFAVVVGLGVHKGIPRSIAAFEDDIARDDLPAVAIVGASSGSGFAPDEDDEHPPSDVRRGEAFTYRIVQALASNPKVWRSSILFVTHDEYGGYYNHVEPPHACDPAGDAAADAERDYPFDQYGFRVPLLVVSPFAIRGHVSHADTNHTSITRFIEHWLDVGALTRRDANAWPMLDLFDFDHPNEAVPVLDPPPTTPPCPAGAVAACQNP